MRDDEEATVRDLAAHRVLITEIIKQHHGRVVDSPGDNILAEFASVVDAVNGSIKIQEEIKKSNTDTPKDRRMEFRIGINLGDVIEEEERIYGDGVNIAARVEGLATAGDISISGTVYEHIKDKLSLGYHYLGEQNVKNIPEPVRVYRLLTESVDAGKMISEEKSKSKKWLWAGSGAIALIILVVGTLLIWNYYFRVQMEPASLDKMAFPLPEEPSIAVLPFDNMSDDPKMEYLSDGITEEIITALSRIKRLFVIARNSTFTYKEQPVKVQQVAEELGVRYVLEGSVQSSGDKLRINVQLIDATTGHHLWAERYDHQLKDIFATQDEITMKVLTFLRVELTEGEQARMHSKGTDNLQAYLLGMQASELFLRFTPEENALARQLGLEAITLDPGYPRSYHVVAVSHLADARFGWSKSSRESMAKGVEFAQKRLALGKPDAASHLLMSFIYLLKREHDMAIAEDEKSIELNPNFANAYAQLGMVLIYAHRPGEAIPMLEKALRLNPLPPDWYFYHLGRAYLMTGRYQEAIEQSKKSLQLNPNGLYYYLLQACAYTHAGREEEAHSAAAEILKINPKFSTVKTVKRFPYKYQSDAQDLIDCLRKAGLPD